MQCIKTYEHQDKVVRISLRCCCFILVTLLENYGVVPFFGERRYLFWEHDNPAGRGSNLIGTGTGIFYPKIY